ncbi:ABC transporter permease [Natrialbaceae archaeon A-CW1-1]
MIDVLRNRFHTKSTDQLALSLILWLSLSVVIFIPIGLMFFYSFVRQFPVIDEYSFTLIHYVELLEDISLLIDVTRNTLIYTIGTTIVALSLGIALALIVEKYFPDSNIQLLILLPYGIPSVASLTGWIVLLGDNGVLTNAIVDIFGLSEAPYTIYSLWGMIWVEGLHTAPVAYLLVLPAIKAIPAAMEEASFLSGASRIHTLRTIVLPIIWPSILSTMIFVSVRTMATVATPSILGVPDRIYTFGSVIPLIFLSGTELSYSKALAFSVLLTMITGVLMLYYIRVTALEGQYTTVTGTGRSASTHFTTNRYRRSIYYGFIMVFVSIAGFLPFLAILWDSLYPNYQLSFTLSNFTLSYYLSVLMGDAEGVSNIVRVFSNTAIVGLVVPISAMVLGLLIAYANQIVKLRTGGLLSFFAAVPLAIPGVVKGLGFLVAYIWTPLYATIGILILAFHSHALPIAMRYASPALTRVGIENFEAAAVVGDRTFGSFKNIILPIVSKDFIAGVVHIYVSVIRNVPIAILLYSTGSEVLAVELLLVTQAGYLKTASTLSVMITLLSLVPYMMLHYSRLNRSQPHEH